MMQPTLQWPGAAGVVVVVAVGLAEQSPEAEAMAAWNLEGPLGAGCLGPGQWHRRARQASPGLKEGPGPLTRVSSQLRQWL